MITMDYDKRLESLPTRLVRQVVDSLRRSTLITSSGASTRIEGSKMSDKDVADYLSGSGVDRFDQRDRREVRGYHKTLEFVFDRYQELTWTENNIKYLHRQLLLYSIRDENHRGNYKQMDNRVEALDADGQPISVPFETTPADLTDKEMSELVGWASASQHHPLLVLANFTVSFLKIHPFLDGNGRLSRLLTNCWLLRCGYGYVPFVSHEKLIEDSKVDYCRTLRASQTTFGQPGESIAGWSDYFLGVLLSQARAAVDLLDIARVEDELSPKQLAVWQYLGQIDQARPGQIAAATGVARMTVAQALAKLAKLGLVVRLGQGRTTRYRRKQR